MAQNDTERFLRALYENAGDGALSVSYLAENDLPTTRWFTKDQLGEMAAYAVECGKTHNTCLNINPRMEALDIYHRGMSDKVLEVVAVYQDFDIKGPAHAEKRLPETEKEVLDYLAELPHPRRSLSGRGTAFTHTGFSGSRTEYGTEPTVLTSRAFSTVLNRKHELYIVETQSLQQQVVS